MNKAEFLEAIKDAPDDAPVQVFVFDEHRDIGTVYYIEDYDEDGPEPGEVTPIVISMW